MAVTNKPLKNYDFNDVVVAVSVRTTVPGFALLVAGLTRTIEGYADGTGILCAKQAENFTFQKGSDGEPLRARTNNDSWLVTLTLMQSSISNDLLSTIVNADLVTGLGVFDLAIRDLSGRTVFEARNCYIQQTPDIEFAREGTSREWQIMCPSARVVVGGNAIAGAP